MIGLIFLYVISIIVVITGYYIEFKGETLEEFTEKIFFSEDSLDSPVSNFTVAIMPFLNTIVAVVFLIIGICRVIKLPFKIINQRFGIWAKIKDLKIKKRK